jgi:hypothetical protein
MANRFDALADALKISNSRDSGPWAFVPFAPKKARCQLVAPEMCIDLRNNGVITRGSGAIGAQRSFTAALASHMKLLRSSRFMGS